MEERKREYHGESRGAKMIRHARIRLRHVECGGLLAISAGNMSRWLRNGTTLKTYRESVSQALVDFAAHVIGYGRA